MGEHLYCGVKSDLQLKQKINEHKIGLLKINYPDFIHPIWKQLTEMMIEYDYLKRPTSTKVL